MSAPQNHPRSASSIACGLFLEEPYSVYEPRALVNPCVLSIAGVTNFQNKLAIGYGRPNSLAWLAGGQVRCQVVA